MGIETPVEDAITDGFTLFSRYAGKEDSIKFPNLKDFYTLSSALRLGVLSRLFSLSYRPSGLIGRFKEISDLSRLMFALSAIVMGI